MNNRTTVLNWFCVFAAVIALAGVSQAQPPKSKSAFPTELEQYLSNETLAVGMVDLGRCNVESAVKMQMAFAGLDQRATDQKIAKAKQLQKQIKNLSDAGMDRLYFFFSPQDQSIQRTTWAGTVNADGDIKAASNALGEIQTAFGIKTKPIEKQRVLIGGLLDQHVRALMECETQPASSAQPALDSLSGYEFGVVLIGSEDSRKILSELAPEFPRPFQALSGKMLAQGVEWSSIGFSLQESQGKGIVQCNNDQLPKRLQDSIPNMSGLLKERNWVAPKITDLVSNELKTTIEGNQLQIDFSGLLKEDGGLADVMKGVTDLQNGQEHLEQLRAIVRGCHGYEEANHALPATANYDKDGKPLLSWRVHILPYMNQNNLYRLFKLDEPWDSEHNRKLVEILPACYFAADASDADMQAGKTVYVRPTGKGTLFEGDKAPTFGMMHDGSVNTALLVRTTSDNAVVWTKPADWEFNPEKPRRGLGLKEAQELKIATADGSAHILRADVTDDQLRSLLDPQDGNLLNLKDVTK